jgi:hypothetical protein
VLSGRRPYGDLVLRRTVALPVVALLALSACGDDAPEGRTAAGVPQRWYAAVADALAEHPDVGSVGLLDDGGPCPLRDDVVLQGEDVSDVSDHGVVRLGGDVPAALCSWYEDTPVELEVAQAADDATYGQLVTGSRARQQRGNVQTERDVVVGGRTVHVVRTDFPTNPAAGTNLTAYLLDEGARGRVRLEVSGTHELEGYDELAVAEDLAAVLGD